MVAKPNNKENIELLGVGTREEILRTLFDNKERSAYKIATEIGLATATIIEHLDKLEYAGFIKSKDAAKGKLMRRYYNITNKGKKALLQFYKVYAGEIQKNKEIAETFSSFLGRT
jgi:predicted transcriptional regulator